MQGEAWWRGLIASSLFHLVIGLLIIVPVVTMDVRAMRERRAALGMDRPGGGGGGRGGTGGPQEEIFYLNVGPAGVEMVPTPTPRPPVPAPEPEPRPDPTPPPPPPEPEQKLEQPPAAPTSPADSGAALASPPSLVDGRGGGSGSDGTAGSGPGSGGGVGSGVGTGRGAGVGPGTGGAATDTIFPPQLLTLALPPLQPPAKVRPYTLVALFDVDERGNTRLIGFNETSDRGFNRRLREVLADVRFRPATLPDGTPVRDTGRFVIEYP